MSRYERLSVGVADMVIALDLWHETLGFDLVHHRHGSDPHLERLWELPKGEIAEQALLATPDAPGGRLHLVRFRSQVRTVRGTADVTDRCPKNLDVNVIDLPERVERLRSRGYRLRSEPVAYRFGDLDVREVQLPVHDDVNLVLAEIVGEPLAVTPRGFGGITSTVTTVDDLDRETEFLERLGFDRLDHHVLRGPQIESMVGLGAGGALELQLLGAPADRFGRAELVRYHGAAGRDLYEQARPPVRGLFRAAVRVDDPTATLAGLQPPPSAARHASPPALPDAPSPSVSVVSPAGWWIDLLGPDAQS